MKQLIKYMLVIAFMCMFSLLGYNIGLHSKNEIKFKESLDLISYRLDLLNIDCKNPCAKCYATKEFYSVAKSWGKKESKK